MPAARSPFATLWPLDPAVAYLNHGSFGACPRAVLEKQAALRAELESEPVDFLWRSLPARLAAARAALGTFLHANPDDLALVPNATTGVNSVLRSLDLHAGDELLTTSHVYPACRKAMEFVASRIGARVVVAEVPFPVVGEDDVLAPVLDAVTPRTRLALLDHVTSPTAIVFPVERLVADLRERGVETLVDGAHAPGMVPVDLDRLGAAFYTGNAHKWLCAPKGSAFLHVRRNLQRAIHPTVISHGYSTDAGGASFRAEFDWTGTSDPTPWLCIGDAIDYVGSLLPGGWSEVMAANRALALEARAILCATLGAAAPVPDSMIGSIASVPLPAPAPGSPAEGLSHEGLMNWFRERGVETWLYPWPCAGGKLVRVSAQLYNAREEYVRLAILLREALG
ncbi:MAG TPA: aminotransferase class V-fold PLP-dependent enzyme [Thermoanaerobaculia bacterium]|nr:aminotransferase class V-fold PLP-dependent enzyme [Thermoanaerobaculia bacterium]